MVIEKITVLLLIVSAIYFSFYIDYKLLSIPIIAAISYIFAIVDPKNQEKYRYADWSLTTPLMLLGILQANEIPTTTSLLLILLDQLMIGSAVLGSVHTNVWFIIGSLFFLPILYYLFHLKQKKPAIYLTILTWSFYPIIWMMDKDKILVPEQSKLVFSILDLISKIGLLDLLL